VDFELEAGHRAVQDQTAAVAAEYKERAPLPYRDRVRLLADQGLLGHLFPKENGGSLPSPGFDALTLCLIRETLGRDAPELDIPFTAQGLGGYPILLSGSDSQRHKYLPRLARGQVLGALALTEPEAGSDLGNIQTRAAIVGDNYVLDGQKKFITNAGEADFYVVCVRTDATAGNRGLSALIVDATTPGLHVTPRAMLADHPIGDLTFVNCSVSRDNLIGREGDGFKVAIGNLGVFRPSVGALAVGLGQRAFELALNHSRVRVQFGKPLIELQSIQFKLANMATRLQAARMLVYLAGWKINHQGVRASALESSMAKLFATEAAFEVIHEAVQIFGGEGVTSGHPVEILYREIRPLLIYEGTSEIQRLIIARELTRHYQ
jgi:acyl-CoA dehydrogenase